MIVHKNKLLCIALRSGKENSLNSFAPLFLPSTYYHLSILFSSYCSQVKNVLSKLLENKKIANATHNIMAYRLYNEEKKTSLQDCDDDGETAAGGRLLHLLQVTNQFHSLQHRSKMYLTWNTVLFRTITSKLPAPHFIIIKILP